MPKPPPDRADECCAKCKHYASAPTVQKPAPQFPYSMVCMKQKEQKRWIETRPMFWCGYFERKEP